MDTTTYARKAHRGKIDHIVRAGRTRCGLSLDGMAVWPASMGSRVAIRPTCEACRTAPKDT